MQGHHYSPLCDTDLGAYLAYLAVVREHGSGVEQLDSTRGSSGIEGRDGGGVDVGVCVGGSVFDRIAETWTRVVAERGGVAGVARQHCFKCSGFACQERDSTPVGWVSGGSVSSGSSDVRDVVGSFTVAKREFDTQDRGELWAWADRRLEVEQPGVGRGLGNDVGGSQCVGVVGDARGGGGGHGFDGSATVGAFGVSSVVSEEEKQCVGDSGCCVIGCCSSGDRSGGTSGSSCDGGKSVQGDRVVDSSVGGRFAVCGTVGQSSNGGVLGANTLRNRQWRQEKKEKKKNRKQRGKDSLLCGSWWRSNAGGVGARVVESAERKGGFFSEAASDVRKQLVDTRAGRLVAENKLKIFEAERRLELERAKDLNQLKKRQETQILRETEVNKVQVEKAFAQLAGSGNVPGVRGFVETVVSDSTNSRGGSPIFSGAGSGSISPNSSISLKEIHEMQKESLRLQAENKELNESLAALKELNSFDYAKVVKPKKPETVDTGYSVDSSGQVRAEYLENIVDISDLVMEKDGKYHYRPGSFDSNWCDNFD